MSEKISLEVFMKKLFEEMTYEHASFSFVDPEDQLIDGSILFKNVFKNNYFLLLFVNSVSELKLILDKQSRYFFLLKEFFSELQEVDKNTSMIIFLRTTELNYESLVLEEDPYYFKKYILPYTSEQFRSFSDEYSNQFDELGIKNVLDDVISDVDLFTEFKSNPEDLSVFNFVSKLFVKIPILKFPIDIDKDVYLLKESIIRSLKKNEKLFSIKQKIDFHITHEETVGVDDETNTKIIESLFEFYKGKGE